MLYVGYIK